MNCHSSTYDQYAFVAETLERLAHAIVATDILVVEEGDLDDRHVQRVLIGIEGCTNTLEWKQPHQLQQGDHTDNKACPYPMIKPSFHLLHLDAGAAKLLNDLVRKFRAAFVRKFVFVVVRWKPEEIIDDIGVLCGVNLDTIRAILPVCREDDDRFRLDFGRNLSTNLAQLRVGRVLRVFHKVGSANAQEVDWHT